MKVAFYYPWIYLKSGGERIIVELTRRSRHDWTLFTSHYEPQNTFPELSDRKVIELPRVPVERDIVSSARAACRIMTQKLPMEDYDALFVLCEGLGDLILYRNHSKPSLCYCLTPLRAAFDPFYRAKSYEQRGFLGKAALHCRDVRFSLYGLPGLEALHLGFVSQQGVAAKGTERRTGLFRSE